MAIASYLQHGGGVGTNDGATDSVENVAAKGPEPLGMRRGVL